MPLLAPVTTAVREGLVVGGLGGMLTLTILGWSRGQAAPGLSDCAADLHMTFGGRCSNVSHKTLIRIAGVLGGLCWLGQAAVNQYDAAGAAVNALYWGGGALILVALVGLGAGLVSGAPWLRLVVGLCVPLLVWSILSILHAEASDSSSTAPSGSCWRGTARPPSSGAPASSKDDGHLPAAAPTPGSR